MVTFDYLIIGSGVAGLTLAIQIAETFKNKTIGLVTKSHAEESNTKYAQGGVAIVLDSKTDSFQKHIKDTLNAGDGLCDQEIVEMVIKEGPKRLSTLIQWGANFDLNQHGHFDLGKEGGHSSFRIVHHKDITGKEIVQTLIKRTKQLSNILIYDHHFAIDLITEHHIKQDKPVKNKPLSCYGAYVLNEKDQSVIKMTSSHTILATGGIGQVYGHTTNPTIATGDGIAMAYRAKAKVTNMEFVQFHPTVFYEDKKKQSFLVSEAVRGFGAFLRDQNGRRFMLEYDERGELASRDIVSRSIDIELKKQGISHVYLDCTHLDFDAFIQHFPTIYQACLDRHIDLRKNQTPVVPAAHYLCGGNVVDRHGKTSIRNLFACGECTYTGLHGANRLASNSLLEALVYANNIFLSLKSAPTNPVQHHIPDWNDKGTVINKEHIMITHNIEQLQALMQNYVGIARSDDRLEKAAKHLDLIHDEIEALYKSSKLNVALCELRNMINIAHLVIQQSLNRKENRGVYYNVDNDTK